MSKLKLETFDLMMFDGIIVGVYQMLGSENTYTYGINLNAVINTRDVDEFPIIFEVDGVDDTFDDAAVRGYNIAKLFTDNVDEMIMYTSEKRLNIEYIPIEDIIGYGSGGF